MKVHIKNRLDISIDKYLKEKDNNRNLLEVFLNLKSFTNEVDSELDKELFKELIDKYVRVTFELKETLLEITKLSNTDNLTGLNNRQYFNKILTYELDKTKRYNNNLSFIIFDIDHFKHVNDNFGHDVGDIILKEISNLVNKSIRKTDTLARWGGEEFVILLPSTPLNKGVEVAEKLRLLIENYMFSKVKNITCSFGISVYRENDDEKSLIKRGDIALYQAKTKGRNCVSKEES